MPNKWVMFVPDTAWLPPDGPRFARSAAYPGRYNEGRNMSPLFGFAMMMFLAVVWNVNTYYIFKRLKLRHPEKYKDMDEPSMVKNNFKSLKLYFKFLYMREWKELNDPKLANMCYLMPFLFIVFIIGMFTLQTSASYTFG